MQPPDYLTTEEQKQLDKLVDVQIEDWQDQKHIHEEWIAYEKRQDEEEDRANDYD